MYWLFAAVDQAIEKGSGSDDGRLRVDLATITQLDATNSAVLFKDQVDDLGRLMKRFF